MSEDRRAQRRRATMQEILDTAVEVMASEGVAGLSLAEVARRMGIRPPSLYGYFPSRMAIYDALFERGMRQLAEVLEHHLSGMGDDPLRIIADGQRAWFAWALANPVMAALLYWRPVPGFEPSAQAYEPAMRQVQIVATAMRAAVDADQLAPAGAAEDGIAMYLALTTGLITQQLANEPGAGADTGRFTRLGPDALEMFVRFYAPEKGK